MAFSRSVRSAARSAPGAALTSTKKLLRNDGGVTSSKMVGETTRSPSNGVSRKTPATVTGTFWLRSSPVSSTCCPARQPCSSASSAEIRMSRSPNVPVPLRIS
ncbi:Uncharacterised protein [Mycobacteroides abscessus subsp. abscessus]|nr:Uncharacterised protein [Mycobacteroides abscessus subsp. abscessus]